MFKPAAEAIGASGLTPQNLDAVAERLDEAAAIARADYWRTQAGIPGVVPFDLGEALGL